MGTLSRNAKTALFSAAVLLVGARFAHAIPTGPSVNLYQESFDWDTDNDDESPVGESLVSNTTGADAYLNIVDSSGNWVVQNEFVPAGESISTSFDLTNASDGSGDSSFTYNQSFTTVPLVTDAGGTDVTTSLGQSDFNNEGADNGGGDFDPAGGFKPGAPAPNSVVFTAGGQTLTIIYRLQSTVPNIQAADNQCVPASLANGLAWMKSTQGLNVTQTNGTGLKGDATLVGVLDTDTSRTVTSRTSGAGVTAANQVIGLLTYLDDSNNTFVKVKHEGFASAANITVTSSGRTMTSQAVATVVSFSWIVSELQAGAAVQAWESWANGAHAVEITGAGYALGVPWLTFTSDLLQTPKDGTDTKGTTQVNFSYLGNPDGNGRLRFLNEAGTPTLTFAVAEEMPEPTSLMLLGASSVGLLLRRRRAC